MHEKDRALLLKIQEYFGGIGNITKPNKNLTVEYRVYSLNDIINFILPHFDKYPLLKNIQIIFYLKKLFLQC